MKRFYQIIMFVLTIVLLTGCLYPEEQLEKNQVPNDVQLETVQLAIDQYREANNGTLPIKNRDSDTPIFQKYPIDFKILKQYGHISSTPGNAFEEGGYYQYVLIDPETSPTVKVLDLRTIDKMREVYMDLELFRTEHIYPPFGQDIAPGIYELDYEKLGYDEPLYVDSPYSTHQLPIIMDSNGVLFVDYRKDVYDILRKEDHNYKDGDDIRYLLTDFYPIAPAYAYPLTIENGEPVFLNDTKNEK